MVIITQHDRNRLAALLLAIRPPHSLAAKLEALSRDDREQYDRWKQRYDDWFERCIAQHDDDIEPEARPYAAMLDRDTSPRLRRDIDEALFGKTPRILNSDTDDTAARKYMEFIQP